MPTSLIALIPNVSTARQLETEELAGLVIQHLNSLGDAGLQQLNRHNFLNYWGLQDYPQEERQELQIIFAEAWAWLERECLIALRPDAGSSHGYFVTRRGRKLVDDSAFEAHRQSSLLPRALLHPRIDARVYPSFLRGAYDTAVFEALREVEVLVRTAGGYGNDKYGKPLMREAFGPNGPLVDQMALRSEQESLADLFAGAIGLYKNASSHRTGNVSDPAVAVEIIMLASHLLRLVEVRMP